MREHVRGTHSGQDGIRPLPHLFRIACVERLMHREKLGKLHMRPIVKGVARKTGKDGGVFQEFLLK